MAKYRVVKDTFLGFGVQKRFLWIFWFETRGKYSSISNTFSTLDEAKEWIEELKKGKQIKVLYSE
jgi:hypothetical protein